MPRIGAASAAYEVAYRHEPEPSEMSATLSLTETGQSAERPILPRLTLTRNRR